MASSADFTVVPPGRFGPARAHQHRQADHQEGPQPLNAAGQTVGVSEQRVGSFVAATGQKPWPSVGSFVAAYGQFFMAADRGGHVRAVAVHRMAESSQGINEIVAKSIGAETPTCIQSGAHRVCSGSHGLQPSSTKGPIQGWAEQIEAVQVNFGWRSSERSQAARSQPISRRA